MEDGKLLKCGTVRARIQLHIRPLAAIGQRSSWLRASISQPMLTSNPAPASTAHREARAAISCYSICSGFADHTVGAGVARRRFAGDAPVSRDDLVEKARHAHSQPWQSLDLLPPLSRSGCISQTELEVSREHLCAACSVTESPRYSSWALLSVNAARATLLPTLDSIYAPPAGHDRGRATTVPSLPPHASTLSNAPSSYLRFSMLSANVLTPKLLYTTTP